MVRRSLALPGVISQSSAQARSRLRQCVLFPIFSYLIEIEHFEAGDRLYHNCLTVPCDNPKAVSRLSP